MPFSAAASLPMRMPSSGSRNEQRSWAAKSSAHLAASPASAALSRSTFQLPMRFRSSPWCFATAMAAASPAFMVRFLADTARYAPTFMSVSTTIATSASAR